MSCLVQPHRGPKRPPSESHNVYGLLHRRPPLPGSLWDGPSDCCLLGSVCRTSSINSLASGDSPSRGTPGLGTQTPVQPRLIQDLEQGPLSGPQFPCQRRILLAMASRVPSGSGTVGDPSCQHYLPPLSREHSWEAEVSSKRLGATFHIEPRVPQGSAMPPPTPRKDRPPPRASSTPTAPRLPHEVWAEVPGEHTPRALSCSVGCHGPGPGLQQRAAAHLRPGGATWPA